MADNEENEIIEHHDDEEMERRGTQRSHSQSFLESVTSLENDDHNSTQSSHRLLAYSDALIAIIATVMILPVAHTKFQENEVKQELKESIQSLLTTKVSVYLMTFLIVTVAWAAHVRLFQVIERIDDTLALLNLACMMLITFLPYTFSLMAAFPGSVLGLTFFCACVIVIGLIQSYVLLAIVIFLPYISLSIKWIWNKAVGDSGQVEDTDPVLFYNYLPSEPLSKERVEAFSDGVYAIVATLLILDICEDNVPDPFVVKKEFNGSLLSALLNYGPEYLAYFGSFATVGLLWFTHHSLFLHVTKATRLMGLFNTFSLAFVGGLPLVYQLTNEFPRGSRNELEAVQISCVIIFFAGLFQLAIWIVGLFNERETLHPYVRYGGREHAFMLAKLSLYPCVALGTFFSTCVLSRFSAPIFHMMEIGVPFAFLLLRLLVRAGLALLRRLFCPVRPDVDRIPVEGDDLQLPINDSRNLG
ncbi:Endosomal/lysosomal potassium channel TMEM175 [Triplophysa tibetana]|uniref:Endosomal/lysosomal proton channel TMEM175 n=1 Tax=Triplophysa tibetana TaxID=1572043 RepID=A0A5A9P6F6_9TELE|nr:Endosomal/lysosomal potassium channel TMEM175 [Triplophysa tibetana]